MKKIISVVQPRAGFIDLSDPDIKLDEILVRQYAEQLNSRAEVPFSICPSLANATIVPINFSDPTSLLYYDLPNYGIAAAQRTFSATRPKCALCGVLNGELDQGIQIIGLETSAGKTISCFPSNLPYLPQLFALPVKTHTPWDMDIHSALQIVLRTDQYYVAQNSTLGASVKEHSHFQVFTFPRKLPVEKAPTRVFGEKQIGENILTFATCDYPQSTLKVTIENAAQIEDEVFAVLENIIKAYKALDTNNHVSFIAKKTDDRIEVYLFCLRPTTRSAEMVSYGKKEPMELGKILFAGMVHSAGIMLRRCPEDREFWQQGSLRFKQILASYSALPEHLAILCRALEGDYK